MMDKINEIVECLKERFNDKEVTLHKVTKNNGVVYNGITIRDADDLVSPVFYLDELVESEISTEMIVARIADTYLLQSKVDIGSNELCNFDLIKDHLSVILVNAELNKECDNYISRSYMDLLMIPIVILDKINGTVRVTKQIANSWHVSEDIIFEASLANLSSEKTVVKRIRDMVSEYIDDEIPDVDMYIVSNSNGLYGANKLLDAGVFKNLSEILNGDLYIIPSSVHELIVIPYTEELDYVNSMIMDVNSTILQETEILSNHAYIYVKGEGFK